MFGVVVRGAAAYVLGILLWTILDELVTAIVNEISPELGASSTTVWALESAVKEFPLVLLFAIGTAVIARAAVESNLGGRGA